MEEKIKNQSINRLDISDHVIVLLKNAKIDTLGKLCSKSKKDLKEIGIEQFEIKNISIELQLMGLSLKGEL